MLLPTEEETAMSPNPFLATITDVIKSGMEVPAARKVKPITCEEQSIVRYHSDNMKGPALTWSAVETNWEISSRCLAIRYTTGFKPFYFHCKSQLLSSLSHFKDQMMICSPQEESRSCCPWPWPTRPSSRSRGQSRWSTQRKLSGRTCGLQRTKVIQMLSVNPQNLCTLCGVYLIKWWLLGCSKISGQTWAKYTSRCKKGGTLWSFKQGL